MSLSIFVKVGAINNLSDARYCAGMNVDLLGFDLNRNSKNYVSPEVFGEITNWLSGAKFVGELGKGTDAQTLSLYESYHIDYLEVNNIELIKKFKIYNKPFILRQDISEIKDLDHDLPIDSIDYLIIESDRDNLSTDEVTVIRGICSKYKTLLGMVSDTTMDELMHQTGAHGIALKGGDEIRPGYKDYDELADILEKLEVDQ